MADRYKTLNTCSKEVSFILVDTFREFEKLDAVEKMGKCGFRKLSVEFKKFVLKHSELKSDSRLREILTHESYTRDTFIRFVSNLREWPRIKEQFTQTKKKRRVTAFASDDSEQTSIQSQRVDQLSDRLTKMKQRHDESEKLHNEKYAALRENYDDLLQQFEGLKDSVAYLLEEQVANRDMIENMRGWVKDESKK